MGMVHLNTLRPIAPQPPQVLAELNVPLAEAQARIAEQAAKQSAAAARCAHETAMREAERAQREAERAQHQAMRARERTIRSNADVSSEPISLNLEISDAINHRIQMKTMAIASHFAAQNAEIPSGRRQPTGSLDEHVGF